MKHINAVRLLFVLLGANLGAQGSFWPTQTSDNPWDTRYTKWTESEWAGRWGDMPRTSTEQTEKEIDVAAWEPKQRDSDFKKLQDDWNKATALLVKKFEGYKLQGNPTLHRMQQLIKEKVKEDLLEELSNRFPGVAAMSLQELQIISHNEKNYEKRYTEKGKRLHRGLQEALHHIVPPVILNMFMEWLNSSDSTDAPTEIYAQQIGNPCRISLISPSTILAQYPRDTKIFDLRLKRDTLIAKDSVVAESNNSTLCACAAPSGRFTVINLKKAGRTEWDDKERDNTAYLALAFVNPTTLASLSRKLVLRSWDSRTGNLLASKQLAKHRELEAPESVRILSMNKLIAHRGYGANPRHSIIDTRTDKPDWLDSAYGSSIKSQSLEGGIIFYNRGLMFTEGVNTELLEPQKIYTLGKKESFGEYYEYAAIFCRLRPSNGFASIQQPVQPVSNITPIALFPDDEITDPSLISFHSSGKHFAHLTLDGIVHVMELPQPLFR